MFLLSIKYSAWTDLTNEITYLCFKLPHVYIYGFKLPDLKYNTIIYDDGLNGEI
jgi:hypothetical protein